MKLPVRSLLIGTAAVASLGIGLAFATSEKPLAHDADADVSLTMDSEIEVLMLRLGMTQEVLAGAGLNGASLQSALAAQQLDLETAVDTLSTHDAAVAEARVTMDALRRKVKSGLATDEEVTALAAAKASFESSTAARETFLQGVCAGFCEQVSSDAASTLETVLASPAWVKKLPVEYRNAERTDEEWLAIRDALASKKTHEQMGFEVPEETTTFLASLNADSTVSSTKTTCEANIAGVQSTWDAVFSE